MSSNRSACLALALALAFVTSVAVTDAQQPTKQAEKTVIKEQQSFTVKRRVAPVSAAPPAAQIVAPTSDAFVECSITAGVEVSPPSNVVVKDRLLCVGKDENGQLFQCSYHNPTAAMIAVALTIGPDTHVTITRSESGALCVGLEVSKRSP